MVGPEPSGAQNGGHDANYANSGSRATMQVSPFGRNLGHSLTSSDTVSPFPNDPHVGQASIAEIKRQRLDPSNIRTVASITSTTGNTDLFHHHQDVVPPAYENLSTHRHSNLTSL